MATSRLLIVQMLINSAYCARKHRNCLLFDYLLVFIYKELETKFYNVRNIGVGECPPCPSQVTPMVLMQHVVPHVWCTRHPRGLFHCFQGNSSPLTFVKSCRCSDVWFVVCILTVVYCTVIFMNYYVWTSVFGDLYFFIFAYVVCYINMLALSNLLTHLQIRNTQNTIIVFYVQSKTVQRR